MNELELYKIIEEYKDEIVAIRRDFHKYPESGWLEFRTTAKIAEILENDGISIIMGEELVSKPDLLGYPEQSVIKTAMERAVNDGANSDYVKRTNGYTGVCAIIDTGVSGPVTAFRFDIDSNELPETTLENHVPVIEGFGSIHPIEDHACGHDGHASIGIITALTLNKVKANLTGKFKFIFQPAEEGVRGGKAIAATGILDDVDYLLSGHIGFGARKNNLIITNVGGFLATTKIDAHITGLPAHAGASPEAGRNALLAAASAALNIHAQCQDGRGVSRVNVGTITAGTGRNVIASSALLKIETRGSSTEINNTVVENTLRTLKASCDIYQTELKTEIVGGAIGAKSDSELSQVVASVVLDTMPDQEIVSNYDLGGSEDVSYMMQAVQSHGGQATYSMFGTEIKGNHHTADFDFNEAVLMKAVKIFAASAMRLSNKGR